MLLMNGYSQSPSWIEFKDASTTVAEGSWTPIELSNSEFWGDAGAEKDKSWFISSLFEGVGTLLLEGDECESGICSVLIVSMGDKAGSDCGNAEEKKRHISNNFLGFPPPLLQKLILDTKIFLHTWSFSFHCLHNINQIQIQIFWSLDK